MEVLIAGDLRLRYGLLRFDGRPTSFTSGNGRLPMAAPNPKDDPTIHALSGPDAEGRVGYIEDHFFVEDKKDQRHLLKVLRLDGTQD